jgi:Skp family chaperone for outer membrane proteins
MISRFPASTVVTFLLTVFAAAQLSGGGLSAANAQEGAASIKIGVIDMQECLVKYYRTEQETAKLNEVAKDKRVELDERNADFMKLNKLLADEDKKRRETSLPTETRQAADAKVNELLQERAAKQNEIQEFQRRIQSEMMTLRQEMEATLVEEAKDTVAEVAEAAGLDMVHDRSFLPRANKAIVYISGKVVDITEGVIAKLNADAPPAAPAAEGDGESKPATSESTGDAGSDDN